MKNSLLTAPPFPVKFGPTWEQNPDWQPGDPPDRKYALPVRTLGWHILWWISKNLLDDEGGPFEPTPEQSRFILWMYAVDEHGKFIYRDIVLQRIKGWGKDPLAAVIAAVEFVGPSRFSHFATEDDLENGILAGEAVGKRHLRAWVQVAAVSQTQTGNTMSIFSGLFTELCKATHGIDIGKEIIYAHAGQAKIQAVTSNPRTMEGNRPTFVIMNEALALDTPIPTPTGWTTMGDLEDGDVIYAVDGTPTTVTRAHEVQHDRDCYRVTFDDGTSVVASDGHWWKVRVANNRNCKVHKLTTAQLAEGGRTYYLPESFEAIEAPEADLPVDPYLLGLWLGDGSSRTSDIACDSQDRDELAAEIEAAGEVATLVDANHVRIGGGAGKGGRGVSKPTTFRGRLRTLGVIQNKHIPIAYLRASREQRLALLQGLMDADGHVRKDGSVARFSNTNVRLLGQVRELLITLGYHAKAPAMQAEYAGEKAHWARLGHVSFRASEGVNPFRLRRKATLIADGNFNRTRDRLRSIVSVEPVESVPVRCITVEHPEHLFLCGPGMHPTSNTHHWLETNNGWEMSAVIKRNLRKNKRGGARAMAITNAYDPSEFSVAQKRRETWEDQEQGMAIKVGVLYDSLEAHEDALLHLPRDTDDEGRPLETDAEYEARVKVYLGAVIDAVKGDAWWLGTEDIVDGILDGETTPGDARRFYYNQVKTSEDAWLDAKAISRSADPLCVEARSIQKNDPLRAGWIIRPEEEIVMFFDGSKSRDTTALMGCRISDGQVFTLGHWAPPPERGARKRWLSPRGEVRQRIDEAFDRFTVVAFFADPSHAKDDEDSSAYWIPMLDDIHQKYKEQLLLWSSKTGNNQHSVIWDMSSPTHQAEFVQAAERFVSELEAKNDVEEFDPAFLHDGHPELVKHLGNAKAYPHPKGYGTSLWKGSRSGSRKIDLAVAAVGARMVRRMYLNRDPEDKRETPGSIWSYR